MDEKWLLISSIGGSISSAGCLIFAALAYFKNNITQSEKLIRCLVFMSVAILFLSIALVLSIHSNTTTVPPEEIKQKTNPEMSIQDEEPLLVFAGGGSVRNYLDTIYGINIKTWPNSINIAMASGSAWRVLAEEYHNEQSSRNNDSLKEFKTICLSASKMSKDFYSECLSDMDDAVVVEVSLGNDNLVTYISDGLLKYWGMRKNKDGILSDTLAQKMQDLIKTNQEIKIDSKTKKVSIFTTNKTSGTLETYKKCFHDIKKYQDSMMLLEFKNKLDTIGLLDSIINKREKYIKDSIRKRDSINLEAMIDNKRAYILYDNMIPTQVWKRKVGDNGEFIMLGSKYYFVKGMGIPKELQNRTNQPIEKPMYLYFLAHHYNYNETNEFTIHKRIVDFLKHLEDKGLNISDRKKWDDIMKKKTITIVDYNSNSNTILIN